MLKNDAIYNLSFRFRDIDFNNINDIYFAINIVIITTTLFKTLIVITLIFKLIIVIVFNIVDIVIVIIIVFERFIFKFIVFDFDIKDYFAMNTSFDKS